ncbi:hypothetical protein HanHA300_Chr02g0049031 [Helianthus annuus]|nr:hypothetical protein HanHA300_Chr02g0049031 [Helianthus annuus]KAJ0776849.1 hypothetical protein HanLR1_Chr02g0050411 [Helianthus annuus]
MVKVLEWDKTLKHNQSINLDLVPTDFEDVTRWVRNSRIGYAVETSVAVYPLHIQEFWENVKLESINNKPGISSTVRNKRVEVTEERIRQVLKLKDNSDEPQSLSQDDILDGFRGMGYAGDFRNKKEIKRGGLTRDWRFIVHVISMSLAHRKGGFDGLNLEWSAAMLSLCTNQKFNLSGLIFNYMRENANGPTWAMYPRFIQMLINDQQKDLPNDGITYKFHVPTSRQYTEIKTNEWVLLHDWMYRAERLPIVKAAYQRYKEGVKAKQQKAAQALAEAAAKEESSKGKRKGKQPAVEEPPKKKKTTGGSERLMSSAIKAAQTEEQRKHIQDLKAIHAMQEKEKREKSLKRKEISSSEMPEVVPEETQNLNDFVDQILVDPDEAEADEGTPKVSPVKPTRISKPPVVPQRLRPFQDLYDRLIKDTGPSVAKEICLLKNQVNDTNILREKLKDQRKKNKEMTAYMAKQAKFVRFQQASLEKLYRMMRGICEKANIEPMFTFDEIFDFEAFIQEEMARKEKEAEAKKKRLESVDKALEGNESEEEEADREIMPPTFIEWGLEDEVLYEQEDGKTFTPEHPEWFRKEREKLPDLHQVIKVVKSEETEKIISWMYDNLRGMFVVKRRGGVIQYFATGFDLFSLPRWDLRELGRLNLLNHGDRGIGRDFERLITKECDKNFPNHAPQRPRRRVSKTTFDPVTGKGKVTWVVNPAKVVTRVKLPEEIPVALKDFKKWFYDSQTGEAVIRSNDNVDIRILDPMDVFQFGLSDLTMLNASRINVGAGNANLEEAALFQRAVERAWKLKRDMLDMVDKIEKRKEKEQKKREARKKKKHETTVEGSATSTADPTTTDSQATPTPPASSTYEAAKEDQKSSEANVNQEPPVAPTEIVTPPETIVVEENPIEPEKQTTEDPAVTTEE